MVIVYQIKTKGGEILAEVSEDIRAANKKRRQLERERGEILIIDIR
jgi:hypothetical protein